MNFKASLLAAVLALSMFGPSFTFASDGAAGIDTPEKAELKKEIPAKEAQREAQQQLEAKRAQDAMREAQMRHMEAQKKEASRKMEMRPQPVYAAPPPMNAPMSAPLPDMEGASSKYPKGENRADPCLIDASLAGCAKPKK